MSNTNSTTQTLETSSTEQTSIENATQAVENASQAVEKASEAVKEVAKGTVENTAVVLETTTNKTLEFFGIPIDVDRLLLLSMEWAGKLLLAILVFFIGKWIGKRLLKIANLAMAKSKLDETTTSFLSNVLYGLMLVAVTLAALNKLGVNTNSFVAILGAATVAIGLALKDQLGNLAAGVMIVLFRPFNQGDFVEIGGKTGTVMDITLVNTRIKTANNHEIIIPNGDIMTTASTNFSSLPQRRVEVVVGIGYENDIATAKELMINQAKLHESVLEVPEPIVRVTALADSSVNLTLYVWAENSDWWAVQCDLLENIKCSFDKNGINIPFPQRTLQIDGLDLSKLNKLLDKLDDKLFDNTLKENDKN